MTVENEAFIDLETMLHEKVDLLWRRKWREIEKDLSRLANEGKWHEAVQIASNINLDDIVEETKALARTLAEAALFLGASRIDDPKNASFFGEPNGHLIDIGVEQWSVVLLRNATIAIQTQAEITLGDLERKFNEDALKRIVKQQDPDLGRVGRQGTQFSRAAAALMISRLSTAGFMMEASARGIQQYRVSEVMDAATCPICAEMHNKTFPVDAGLASSTTIMQATDPESLRAVSPFPSQSAASVKAISAMSQGQLIGAGLNLPPYHPNCRGIATIEGGEGDAGLGGSAIEAGVFLSASADLTPDQLAARMFGDFDDLDGAILDNLLGSGVGASFNSE
jgi:hypothetical protein